MIRLLAMLAILLLAGTVARAQTSTTQPQPARPRPGTILETPASGRITDAPATQPVRQAGPWELYQNTQLQ